MGLEKSLDDTPLNFSINESVTEPAQSSLENGGRSSLRAHAEPGISTKPSRLLKFGRWLAIVVSVANVLVAVAILVVMWKTIANAGTPLLTRIDDSAGIIAELSRP